MVVISTKNALYSTFIVFLTLLVMVSGGTREAYAGHRVTSPFPTDPARIVKADTKSLCFTLIDERIKVDGKLDEPFYATLKAAQDFTQFHPKNGAEATFKTWVFCYYDHKNIYFAFQCFDDEPKKIIADITPFGEYESNDEIVIYLDTFLDKQTYREFAVNPRGIKKGEKTVWDAETNIDAKGWTVEIKIPLKSLRFPVKDIQQWAVNFKRFVFRLNETSYWSPVPRDKENIFGDTFGNLAGLSKVKGGKNIEIFPYAGYRNSRFGDEKNNKFAYGLDLKYGITSNLTLDITTSPDYSEVESDPFFYQVAPFEFNLSDNRPFYYEGGNYFETAYNLFYSRRITDPTLAVKLTGKEKGYSMGFLLARNNPTGDVKYHGVLRLKKDIFKLSTIGIIYTSIEEDGNWNRNFGMDFDFKFKDIYRITGMAAYAYNKHVAKKKNGMYRLEASRLVAEGLSVLGRFNHMDSNVHVPAGLTYRNDYSRFHGILRYNFRWEDKWLEKLVLRLIATNETSADGSIKTESTREVMVEFISKSRLRLVLSCIFGKIRPQIVNAFYQLTWGTRSYDQQLYYGDFSYSGGSWIQFGFDGFVVNDFIYTPDFMDTRDGVYGQVSSYVNLKFNPQLQLELKYSKVYYESDDKDYHFSGDLLTSTLNYQITKKLSTFIKMQYDSDLQRYQYDFLIGYEPGNTSKIYFSIKNSSERRLRLFHPDARSIAFKISYLFRI
ncbi:MAG: carbohydrate binding family 9 domain-containing protein [bacterium]|nr:carbohydrate binding family 9 domain-containing protein [bacterium]